MLLEQWGPQASRISNAKAANCGMDPHGASPSAGEGHEVRQDDNNSERPADLE